VAAVRTDSGRSRIHHSDWAGTWYALDNAAVIMPSVTRGVDTYLFRLSATVDEALNLAALQRALDRVAARFPYFNVEIRRGLFWHYLEPHEGQVRVMADLASPCQDFEMRRKGTCLLRVKASGRRVACEFSHVLTDGTGGLRFLKNLVAEYFRQRGLEVDAALDADLYDLDAPPSEGETEDAYHRYFPHGYPHPDEEAPAFWIPSAPLRAGEFRVTCGIVPLGPAMAKAKELGGSLTEFLTAVYFEALQSIWLATPPKKRRRWRLAVEVPVNMRKFYPTETNRNFSLFVNPEEDMRLGERSLEDLVARTRHQLRLEIDRPSMARHISRNVGGQLLFFVRALPLFLKAPIMRLLYAFYGDNKVSGVLSNLGPVTLPPALAAHVERFDFIPAPSSTLKTRASMVSWKDFLYISFGSLGRERELERLFFSRLAALGLPVKVECNLEAT
jgi:hypothetical protein